MIMVLIPSHLIATIEPKKPLKANPSKQLSHFYVKIIAVTMF